MNRPLCKSHRPLPRITVGITLSLLGLFGGLSACSQRTPETGGDTVTILGVVTGAQQSNLEQALRPFEEATGIDVIYEGSDDFATI